jgi:antitoxin component of MazEF toxin-antitoxin module
MTVDGGPPPDDDGYPAPDKYVPDNLGEKKVWESNGRVHLTVPTAVLRHWDAEEGDVVRFEEEEGQAVIMEPVKEEQE